MADGDALGWVITRGWGDVTGDGRKEVSTAGHGGLQAVPGTGEWFAFWEQPRDSMQRGWKKTVVADKQAEGDLTSIPRTSTGMARSTSWRSRGHGVGLVWYEAPGWRALMSSTCRAALAHCLAVVDIDLDGDVDAATLVA